MEAPVPASALIHSATLVSAGIYLILRFKNVLLLSEYAVTVLPLIGAFTAALGAFSSAFQTDAKRLLAYSTISHCGFLVVSAIVCESEYTILYLYVHGFFKAASFICVGNVIRFNMGGQDIRTMGGFYKYLPFECYALCVSLLCLAGAPFSFGFFMKHLLMASVPTTGSFFVVVHTLLFVAACLGVVYCTRLFYEIFFGPKKANKHVYCSVTKCKGAGTDQLNKYYTNATLGAAFAIFGLILSGLCICAVFCIVIYYKLYNKADFGSTFTSAAQHSVKEYLTAGSQFNFGFLNLALMYLFVFICIISFSHMYQAEARYELLAFLFCFATFVMAVLAFIDFF
jgi:NADH:ubiquinone oxidoreductase subunit 5 (subunit L)/multisubunit Na+/H+ antiporter MnhA subunit